MVSIASRTAALSLVSFRSTVGSAAIEVALLLAVVEATSVSCPHQPTWQLPLKASLKYDVEVMLLQYAVSIFVLQGSAL
jgi:hypothetical protein